MIKAKLLLLLLTASLLSEAQGTWTRKANFGGGHRNTNIGFSIGNKGYIGTGGNKIGSSPIYYKDFWEYDVLLDKWTQKSNVGVVNRAGGVAISINSKGYVGTGVPGYLNDWMEFNDSLGTWSKKADFPGSPRFGAVAFSINGLGFVGTGYDNTYSYKKDFWCYNPSNDSWVKLSDYAGAARDFAVSFVVGDKAYIGTGSGSGFVESDDFWEYNPALDSWTEIASLPGPPRQGAMSFSIGDKGYVYGGFSNNKSLNDFWEYTPSNNTWKQLSNYSVTSRSWGVGFTIGDKGYLGTGRLDDSSGKSYLEDFWEFQQDLATRTKEIPSSSLSLFYPNLLSEDTKIILNYNVKQGVLKIYDVSGRVVDIKDILGNELSIEFSNLSSGIYYYQLYSRNNFISSGKFVIQ